MEKKIDLHIHTNCSDGGNNIYEVIDMAINNKLDMISITDHDTVMAYGDEVFKYAYDRGIELVTGVEISVKYNNETIHVLGYNIDVENADVIVSNPPYIKSDDIKSLQKEVLREPLTALDGGEDGLDFYRIINDKWADKLNNNGTLLLEIGEEQGSSVKDILTNFSHKRVIKDMYGNDRIVCSEK